MYHSIVLALLLAMPTDFEDGAARALGEFRAACQAEGGRLWGATLCGPMVVVEPASRRAVANTADGDGVLTPRGEVYVGELPGEHGLANTAFDWSGRRWSMVLWPLPDEPSRRRTLLLHEAWHRLQPSLGFEAAMVENGHLAQGEGRLWLRLEWRALARALESQGEARRRALADATLFRRHRYGRYPEAREQEAALELNEGLAQFTGVVAGYGDDAVAAAVESLGRAEEGDALSRSFAYATGPPWGLLLDALRPGWRGELEPGTNFADLAGPVVRDLLPEAPTAAAARHRAEPYGLAELEAEEQARESARLRELERYRLALVEAPTLVLPLAQMQMQFDPGAVVPLPPHGSVYRTIAIQDRWGEVEVTGGALLSSDFTSLALPGPATADGAVVRGPGWVLRLGGGWRAEPAERSRWTLHPPSEGSGEE